MSKDNKIIDLRMHLEDIQRAYREQKSMLLKLVLENEELKKQLNLHDVGSAFYCKADIERETICSSQCNTCKEYYKPLEQ